MQSFYIPRAVSNILRSHFSGFPVVFHHVPKCGGSSLSECLRNKYFFSYFTLSPRAIINTAMDLNSDLNHSSVSSESYNLGEKILLYNLYEDRLCVQGHFRYSEKAFDIFQEKYKFITILRDPISQFLSHYFYNTQSSEKRWRIDSSIDEFIDSEAAKNYGEYFILYFSGLPQDADFSSDEAIQRAKKNIENLHAIGFLDDMPTFEKTLSSILNLNISISHLNKNPVDKRNRDSQITKRILKKVEDVCAPNLQLYYHARSLFKL